MTPRQGARTDRGVLRRTESAEELLTLLDLGRCARTPWRRLSGGEQQRTLLALALLGRPRVLVLDEADRGPSIPKGAKSFAISSRPNATADVRCGDDPRVDRGRADVESRGDHEPRTRRHPRHASTSSRARPRMIVELSGPVDPALLATKLECVVTADGANRLRCETESTPERMAVLNDYLTSVGVTLLTSHPSVARRALLELIEQERREVRP